ncbi:hypothetical protein C343_04203 [Cryptococcus neoformans C23]|uniref:Nitrogen regulatory protein areA GATA-like domain-containing protein n=1 Tax=Cryptococcus neoformans (strain H99 / ATCC 208821 / CBS 10515 / FGSC 9487) TaxID=235443 RepID=J9VNP4_CRYN9|nr:hypothetical protein CNAG_05767 [Cryptococcus neoformans var. grubii H99]XP_012050512.1 hypothetical protein, variant [Cryptococcus neoformans var. grubii H99]AUB25962.1 hypothetical protein CKF44_05767 [Cryptococcus neoformans var. grubii]OWZ30503.1 hypothetical protein C347_04263 [Cryptococcus neoformans var. grubii AD2-60a]OWZ42276.1 hypothetical protein C343_04203 [Cryptococcus neoformans var. grubii C23]OXC83793.1 hypothetical protein C344_03957 [Cryptococcus neoformans var. grubii AD1|eukprot:XP_012050511.1 hypothetical protein CNAG_05767 [Cryptococcus neoformans var. grubii H99]
MAQVIPPITSLPSDSGAAPSVEDIQDRLPSICVDYLSHDWSEEDVWASWRNMTRHKHEIANGVRLENASWRTWQKQRNKLKTISPETLNWLKDSDVTWLYGPLHTANVEPSRPLRIASTDDRLGIDGPDSRITTKKPILKHRTLSEMLTIPMPSSPVLEHVSNDGSTDTSGDDDDRPNLLQTKSDTNIFRTRGVMPRRRSPPRHHNLGKTPSELPPLSPSTESQSNPGKRHISFNTFVEQCVAVDDPTQNQQQNDSDDDVLEMKPSSMGSRSSRASRPSLSRASSTGSEHITIAKIAPTMLKTGPGVNHTTQMVYAPPPEYQSPGYDNLNSYDFPSPQVEAEINRWQAGNEGYGSVGYDYFNGPDFSGNADRSSVPIPAHVGTSYGGGRPSPNKYRPAASSPQQSFEPSSVSSSNSSSSVNITSPVQPGRGILKTRPPDQAFSPESSSPPSAYFNYTPSAATGIGGMRGSSGTYDYPGPLGSPVTSPAVGTEERGRGRTPSRERLHDRSTSRGTSSGSASSKSPTEIAASHSSSRKVQTPPQLDKVQEETRHIEPEKHVGVNHTPQASQSAVTERSASTSVHPFELSEEDKDYIPDRSDTPTPHSSPQIAFRPLKDTSPASLPHTPATPRPSSSHPPDFPAVDPPTTVPSSYRSNAGARATIAHVGTNAQPTLFQPTEDDDGASIMGRAANIASTAKDLLGALWYGANDGQGDDSQHDGQGQTQGRQRHGTDGTQGKNPFHKRSGSGAQS